MSGREAFIIRVWVGIFLWISVCSCRTETHRFPFMPEVLLFAGDTIPLDDPEVREKLERELLINQHWHASTMQWLRKSQRWFPVIDSLLKVGGIPADFRYIIPIESGFENVNSPKGAAGFWQLMEATGLEFGLTINPEIDERLNPEKATLVACRLLRRGFNEFKSWPEAAVSYNIGIHGMKSVMKSQYTDSYYDLLINSETGRYLYRVLAAKLILENPEEFGFEYPAALPACTFRKAEITDSIPDLAWWCRKNGFSYKNFRILNPWIRKNTLHIPEGIKSLPVKIPVNCRLHTEISLPSMPVPDSIVMQNHKAQENLVEKKDVGEFGRSEMESNASNVWHQVEKGENLSIIARRYGITVAEIFRLNPDLKDKAGEIHEGSRLMIRP